MNAYLSTWNYHDTSVISLTGRQVATGQSLNKLHLMGSYQLNKTRFSMAKKLVNKSHVTATVVKRRDLSIMINKTRPNTP